MKKNQITLFICLAANLVFAQQKHEINVGLTGVRYNMNFTPGVSIAYFYKVLPKYALGLITEAFGENRRLPWTKTCIHFP